MSSNKHLQATMSKAARDRALVKAVNWQFIDGDDVLYINEQAKKYARRKTV
jgi:hypothetical protein